MFSDSDIEGGIISSDLEFEKRSQTKYKKRKLKTSNNIQTHLITYQHV